MSCPKCVQHGCVSHLKNVQHRALIRRLGLYCEVKRSSCFMGPLAVDDFYGAFKWGNDMVRFFGGWWIGLRNGETFAIWFTLFHEFRNISVMVGLILGSGSFSFFFLVWVITPWNISVIQMWGKEGKWWR